ncbi:MAG: hypothetical protein GY913_33330, partial [Proteobacteria bacterium]|nr:hypothetical protein [Pseudomonadota bacterium]
MFYGDEDGMSRSGEIVQTSDPETSGELGHEVGGPGDIDGDGFADIAIGDPRVDSIGAGDVDADGFPDLVVGAPGTSTTGGVAAGAAYVFWGSRNGMDPTTFELLRADGADTGDRVGAAVAGAGDVNGDGYADVVLGAWTDDINDATDAGSGFLFYGCGDECEGSADDDDTSYVSPFAGDDGFQGCGCTSGTPAGFAAGCLALLGVLLVR